MKTTLHKKTRKKSDLPDTGPAGVVEAQAPISKWRKLELTFHTIRYLRPSQWRARIFYGLRGLWRKLTGFHFQLEYQNFETNELQLIQSLPCTQPGYIGNNTFSFFNLEKKFEGEINWSFYNYGELYCYEFTNFEFLHQEGLLLSEKLRLVRDCVSKKEIHTYPYDAYPCTLRLIFLTRFLVEHQIKDREIDNFLYVTLKILLQSLEYHLYGNHLLLNGFALLYGAYYFNDPKVYRKACEILESELQEQIHDDGGHFELSTMYHKHVLARLLDCVNLVKHNDHFGKDLLNLLNTSAAKMIGWLEQMTFRDGTIPLMSDSAGNAGSSSQELFDFAERLGIQSQQLPLSGSGFRKVAFRNYELVMDVGNIGAPYIAGHAHADTLAFVLQVNNQPFLIETGTSTYATSARRMVDRQTSSHNTVTVDDLNQSELWASFRIARRAKTTILQEDSKSVEAHHDGYKKRKGVYHRRKFEWREDQIHINDQLLPKKGTEGKAYFHFAPDVNILLKGNELVADQASIKFNQIEKIYLEDFYIAEQFNVLKKTKRAVVLFKDELITTISFN